MPTVRTSKAGIGSTSCDAIRIHADNRDTSLRRGQCYLAPGADRSRAAACVARLVRGSDRPHTRGAAVRVRPVDDWRSWSGSATLRAEPFDALEIGLTLLWEDPPAER